jgi:hypothetical protein
VGPGVCQGRISRGVYQAGQVQGLDHQHCQGGGVLLLYRQLEIEINVIVIVLLIVYYSMSSLVLDATALLNTAWLHNVFSHLFT